GHACALVDCRIGLRSQLLACRHRFRRLPMKRTLLSMILASAAFACGAPAAAPRVPSTATTATPAAAPATDLATRRKPPAALRAQQWEYKLRTSPELATVLGDHRYNDRWSDFSIEETQRDLAKAREFLARFEAIDTTGFPDQEVLNQQLMVRDLKQNID